jgi:hypothetical protein
MMTLTEANMPEHSIVREPMIPPNETRRINKRKAPKSPSAGYAPDHSPLYHDDEKMGEDKVRSPTAPTHPSAILWPKSVRFFTLHSPEV